MNISLDDVRRHYSELSDDALLEQDPGELTPEARELLLQELHARGLSSQHSTLAAEAIVPAPIPDGDPFEVIGEFGSVPEAEIAQALLEAEDISSRLTHTDTTGLQTPAANFIGLAVATADATRAKMVLERDMAEAGQISDEELAAQAEAAGLEQDPEDLP